MNVTNLFLPILKEKLGDGVKLYHALDERSYGGELISMTLDETAYKNLMKYDKTLKELDFTSANIAEFKPMYLNDFVNYINKIFK